MMRSFKNAQDITHAVPGVWRGRYGSARCSAHDNKLPSLFSSIINMQVTQNTLPNILTTLKLLT